MTFFVLRSGSRRLKEKRRLSKSRNQAFNKVKDIVRDIFVIRFKQALRIKAAKCENFIASLLAIEYTVGTFQELFVNSDSDAESEKHPILQKAKKRSPNARRRPNFIGLSGKLSL